MKRQHDECRQWLDSYKELRVEVNRLMRRHQQLWTQATKVTTHMSLVPGGGTSDKDALLTLLADADEEILSKLEEAQRRQQEIEEFIDDLPTVECRIILRLRYVELYDWRTVELMLEKSNIFYSDQHIFYLHGKALQEARALWSKRKENHE